MDCYQSPFGRALSKRSKRDPTFTWSSPDITVKASATFDTHLILCICLLHDHFSQGESLLTTPQLPKQRPRPPRPSILVLFSTLKTGTELFRLQSHGPSLAWQLMAAQMRRRAKITPYLHLTIKTTSLVMIAARSFL